VIREKALQETDDAALISRCVSWEAGAWEAFVARHSSFVQAEARRQLLRYLARAVPSDVDDACQEVFSLLMKDGARTLRQFRGESSLSTWLACVVRSVCRQFAQHERSGALGDREIAGVPPSEDHLPPEGLGEALARLPARDQKLLRLFFYEGKKYREISSELGISVNSVGPLLGRAIGAARRLLTR
jgi:RNA polymerase sigma-70 factor (ECF subfamily)